MTLVDLIVLSRPLVVLDAETTGLDVEEARIVELGLMVLYPEGTCATCMRDEMGMIPAETCKDCGGTTRQPTLEWRTLVNPGVPIPPMAAETHGITDARVQGCQKCGQRADNHPVPDSEGGGAGNACAEFKPWPRFVQLASRLARFLSSVDFAGKHVRYDLRVLAKEMARAGVEWSYAGAAVVDADRNEQTQEPRDLSSLYRRRCGKEPVDAHSALADVKMTAELIAAQLALWPDLPRTPAALHALQWADWIDAEGKFRFDKLGRPIVRFGKHDGKEMKDVPGSYWDFVLSPKEKFSEEIKQLAREAKLGKFPVR